VSFNLSRMFFKAVNLAQDCKSCGAEIFQNVKFNKEGVGEVGTPRPQVGFSNDKKVYDVKGQ